MPPHTQTQVGLEVDHANFTIRFVRSFDAPAALLFEAWTRPEHLRCWWDAAGGPLAVCEIDLRLGGTFRFVSPGHPDMPFTGVYLEIAPPHRLVFEALNSTGRVQFASTGDKTRMTLEIVCRSAEQLEEFLQMGVAAGTSQTLDNLVAYIQRQGVAA
jgi:uncharacterized protein YndB with AHSA1/START domain